MSSRLSILTTVYNGSSFIEEAVNSVLKQTYKDWEFIIIDDCSEDSSYNILKQYEEKDDRIKLYRMERNYGQTICLNFGISKCSGEYIVRFDIDDLMLPQRLEVQAKFMENNHEYGLCGSFVKVIDNNSNYISTFHTAINDKSIRENLMRSPSFYHPSVMIRKSVLDLVGGYDIFLTYSQDYKLWLSIQQVAKVYNIPEPLTIYRFDYKFRSVMKIKYQKKNSIALRLFYRLTMGNMISYWQVIKDLIYLLLPKKLILLILGYQERRDLKSGKFTL